MTRQRRYACRPTQIQWCSITTARAVSSVPSDLVDTRNPDAHGAARQAADPPVAGKPSVPQRQETGNTCIYDIPSMKNATPESIGLVEMTRSAIISSDDPELEEMDDPSRIPPGRGI